MSLKFYKTWERVGLSDGASWVETWVAEEDMVIKRIHIVEKGGTTLRKSTFYFKIAGRVYTRELIPCSIFGPDVLVTPVINVPFKKAEEFSFTLKNQEGAAIDLWVSVELEPA